ncbi:44357_t:CDS:2 [Gigaspora margarita]|uniref:44357_t:CDS:1 n=1 Tax=Gigaspora margarita TaxID=4874 RepID=A0ABN7UA12_GIGMA|nr:44357_t:CDS:2 [Gigaspora margarita]
MALLNTNLSQTIKFKYFFPTDQPLQMFANGDIVFILGKFIVENLEPCFTIAYPTIINSDNPNHEFNTSDIPMSMLHCLYSVIANREPKKVANFIHFGVEIVEYNSITSKSNVKMDMTIIYPSESPSLSIWMSANATNANTRIDQSYNTKRYHTTIEDYQSDEIKSDNEGNNEKNTDSVNIDQKSQGIEKDEEKLQPKKRKKKLSDNEGNNEKNMDLIDIDQES